MDNTKELNEINELLNEISDDEFEHLKPINHIAGHIYVGDWNSINNEEIIKSNQIEYSICLSEEKIECKTPNHVIKIPDTPKGNIEEYFDQTYKIILNCCERNQNVLVMSDKGCSRSAIIVIHYLLKRYYITGGEHKNNLLLDIFKFYITKRPCDAEPNFIYKLILEHEKIKNGADLD